MSSDDESTNDDIITEEMLWERIPQVQGAERAETFYELSARIYARGQYDEALALAETARDIYSELGAGAPLEGLAQAYSAIGYNLNQLHRIEEAANAMTKAVELLREHKSPMALELACTLGEWLYSSKEYRKAIECIEDCVQEHLVDGNDMGAANDFYLIGCARRDLGEHSEAISAFNEARTIYKKLKEVVHVARCDQKIAYSLVALGDAEGAEIAAQRALDVFQTANDHRRETFALFELGKARILSGNVDNGLATLRRVLRTIADSEDKDFEFILEVEEEIAKTLRASGDSVGASEIERRIETVREIIEEK